MHIFDCVCVLQDLIIFPGDAEFKRVSQCTTGRVFILKFKDSARKYFYWMQEPSEDKDEDLIKKVLSQCFNCVLNACIGRAYLLSCISSCAPGYM